MRNHLSETLMLNDIQITSDYMSRWVVLKRRVGAVTRQRVLKVRYYEYIYSENLIIPFKERMIYFIIVFWLLDHDIPYR
jgi:hypothetical protein